MFCYCRLFRQILSESKFKNRTNAIYTRSYHESRLHTEFFPKENEAGLQEKKAEIVQDVSKTVDIWKNYKNNEIFRKFASDCFIKNQGSSSYAADMFRVLSEYFNSPDMAFSLMVAFNKYLHDNSIQFSPSVAEKKDILVSVLKWKNFHLVQLACNVFKITEQDGCVKKLLDSLVEEEKFLEAAFCISALQLHYSYDIEKVVIPIFLNGKLNNAVPCISNHPDLQLKIAQKLDEHLIIAPTRQTSAEANQNSKKAFRALNSMLNVFKIPPEHCKNLCYIRGRAAINLLIKRKLQQSVTDDTWEGMVMTIVGDNPELKKHLVYKLMSNNEKETAIKMAEKLGVQDFDFSTFPMKESIENVYDLEDVSDTKSEANHLTFELQKSDIKFVDTEEDFKSFIHEVTEKYTILGIDSEWKPHFGLSKDRLALIQVAAHDKVYILDMLTLTDHLTADHWDELMDKIFGNPNIIKLGCGIMTDVQMIVEDNKGTTGKTIRFSHILDMAIFYDKLEEVYPEEMGADLNKKKQNRGLSQLCDLILGKPLNKEERLCDWEKRPLVESQLGYAALDAHCLLQMYDKLKIDATEKVMNFDHLARLAMHFTTRQWRPKKKLKGSNNEIGLQINKPIPIKEFQVVVDAESDTQGKELRQLGADVFFLCRSDSLETALQVSKDEKRVLICSARMWKKLQNKVPEDFSFVTSDYYGKSQPISHILQKFNVVLKAKEILSCCKICNSEDGIKLSYDDVKLIQEHIASDNRTLQSIQGLSELNFKSKKVKRTISSMIQFGMTLKLSDLSDKQLSEEEHAFLCTKCGSIQ